jgi:hypothetical protein
MGAVEDALVWEESNLAADATEATVRNPGKQTLGEQNKQQG